MGWDAQDEDGDERGVGRVVNRADRRLYSRWGGSGPRRASERLVMKAVVTRVTSIEKLRGEMTPKILKESRNPRREKGSVKLVMSNN